MRNGVRHVLASAALPLVLGAGAARADTLPALSLPTLALDPAPAPSLWTGLYVGSEVFAISHKGPGGHFGGDVYAGYERAFANNVVLGIQGTTGYSPAWGGRLAKGFDFAATDVKLGYAMGRFLPYVTAGVALQKLHGGPGAGYQGPDSINALFSDRGDLHAATRVGVGVDYAITNNLTIGVAVSAISGAGPLVP